MRQSVSSAEYFSGLNGEMGTGSQFILVAFSHFSHIYSSLNHTDSFPEHPRISFAQPHSLLKVFHNKFYTVVLISYSMIIMP